MLAVRPHLYCLWLIYNRAIYIKGVNELTAGEKINVLAFYTSWSGFKESWITIRRNRIRSLSPLKGFVIYTAINRQMQTATTTMQNVYLCFFESTQVCTCGFIYYVTQTKIGLHANTCTSEDDCIKCHQPIKQQPVCVHIWNEWCKVVVWEFNWKGPHTLRLTMQGLYIYTRTCMYQAIEIRKKVMTMNSIGRKCSGFFCMTNILLIPRYTWYMVKNVIHEHGKTCEIHNDCRSTKFHWNMPYNWHDSQVTIFPIPTK